MFDKPETEFKIFCSQFSVTLSDVPIDMQHKIIGLQRDSILEEKLASVGVQIHKYLFPGYHKLRPSCQNFYMFGTTYIRIIKNRRSTRLTNKNLNDILKLAVLHGISANIDADVKAKRRQVSGSC